MQIRARRLTRRGAGAAAALALGTAGLFNLPAQAEPEGCAELQAAYIAFPEARPSLVGSLQSLGCTVPNTGTSTSTSTSSTTSSSSTSTSAPSSTTSTTADPVVAGCAALQERYLAEPALRPALLTLLQSLGCTVPGGTTSSSSSSTTSSSTTSSSTTSSTIDIPTSTTISVDAGCAGLLQSYNAFPEARPQLLPLLAALGCPLP